MSEQANLAAALAVFAPTRAMTSALLAGHDVHLVRPGAALPDEVRAMALASRAGADLGAGMAAHPDASPALLARLARRRLSRVDAALLLNQATSLPVFLEVLARKGRVTTASTDVAMSRCTLAQLASVGATMSNTAAAASVWESLAASATSPADVAWAVENHFMAAEAVLDAVAATHPPEFVTGVVAALGNSKLDQLAHDGDLSAPVLAVFLAELAGRTGSGLGRRAMVVASPQAALVIARSHWAPQLVHAVLNGTPAGVASFVTRDVLVALLASGAPGMYGRYALWVLCPQTPPLPAPAPITSGVQIPAATSPRLVPSQRRRAEVAAAVDAQVAAVVAALGAGAGKLAGLLEPLGDWGMSAYAFGRLGVPRPDVLLALAHRHWSTPSSALREVANLLAELRSPDEPAADFVDALTDALPQAVFYAAERFGDWAAGPPAGGGGVDAAVTTSRHAWASTYLAQRVWDRFGETGRAWTTFVTLGPALAASGASLTEILDAIEMALAPRPA